MTKNRAQKKNARERAAETGESYADAKRKADAVEPYPYEWEFLDSIEKMTPAVEKYEVRLAAAQKVVSLCENDPEAENEITRKALGEYHLGYLKEEEEIELNLKQWYASRAFKPLTITTGGIRAATEEESNRAHAFRQSGLKERYSLLQETVDELDEKIKASLHKLGY